MNTDENFDDLRLMFEAQDGALQDEAFVQRATQRLGRRARWRSPLLFGAAGLGVGAALSQAGGLWSALVSRTPTLQSAIQDAQAGNLSLDLSQPFWIAGFAVVLLSCLTVALGERA